jgi:hypothetical protein
MVLVNILTLSASTVLVYFSTMSASMVLVNILTLSASTVLAYFSTMSASMVLVNISTLSASKVLIYVSTLTASTVLVYIPTLSAFTVLVYISTLLAFAVFVYISTMHINLFCTGLRLNTVCLCGIRLHLNNAYQSLWYWSTSQHCLTSLYWPISQHCLSHVATRTCKGTLSQPYCFDVNNTCLYCTHLHVCRHVLPVL